MKSSALSEKEAAVSKAVQEKESAIQKLKTEMKVVKMSYIVTFQLCDFKFDFRGV